MEPMAERVGQTIVQQRTMRGWSRSELARRTSFTPQGLWKIETGKTDPPISTLNRIAQALELPLAELVAESERDQEPGEAVKNAFADALGTLLQSDSRVGRYVLAGVLRSGAPGNRPGLKQHTVPFRLELGEVVGTG